MSAVNGDHPILVWLCYIYKLVLDCHTLSPHTGFFLFTQGWGCIQLLRDVLQVPKVTLDRPFCVTVFWIVYTVAILVENEIGLLNY